MTPPRLARAVLRRMLPKYRRDFVIDDLDEAYDHLVQRRGPGRARRWYRWQACRGLGWALILRLSATLRGFWGDVRGGFQVLHRNPAFTGTAILVLGLGIGVNTAAFSVANAVFFRPLAVRSPGDVIYVYQTLQSGQVAVTSHRDVQYLRQHSQALSDVSAHWQRSVLFAADDETDRIDGEHVDANYFNLLGVTAAEGRLFLPEDDELSSTQPVVVISDEWWTHRFRRDPATIGKRVRIDNKEFTIVGITPAAFRGLSNPWTPSRYWVTSAQYSGPQFVRFGAGVIGRIRPGLSFQEARAMLLGETARMSQERIDQALASGYRLGVTAPLPHVVLPASSVRTPFDPRAEVVPARLITAVISVMTAVLLIAAVNIAGILMARGVARAPELAARRALGASAARLVRQMLTESVVLSLSGGLVGLMVAWFLIGSYRAFTPERYVIDVVIDFRVLMFAAVVCVGAGLIVGLAPALQGLRVDVVSALGAGSGAGTTSRYRRRLRHGIVVPQVMLALVLLVVAGVHVRALRRVERTDLGYGIDDRVRMTAGYWSADETTDERQPSQEEVSKRAARSREFYRRIFEGVRRLPPGISVAITDRLPTYSGDTAFSYISQTAFDAGGSGGVLALRAAVSPGYFRTMAMRVLNGRDFDDRDAITATPVAIVSKRLASRLWPGGDPIGQRIAAYAPDKTGQKMAWLEIVGMVNDVDPVLRGGGDSPFVYVALSQQWQVSWPIVVAWAPGNSASLVQDVKRAIITADPFAQVSGVQTLREVVGEILYPRRAAAGLLVLSGFAGLVLACIGLYGVVSYSVAQRAREIGVRMALGASRMAVTSLVFREAALVTASGALIGLVVSVGVLRLTSNLVGSIPSSDPLVFVLVPVVVSVVVLLGCYSPSVRAANTNPVDALRRG